MKTLGEAIPAGDRILVDSSVLAAYFDRLEATWELAAELLDGFVRAGRNQAVVSTVSVMETLVRPLRTMPAGYTAVLAFCRDFPNLTAMPVDLDVAHEAAVLRAGFRLSPPDALIAATGFVGGVSHLVTNDRAWRSRLEPLRDRAGVVVLVDLLVPR